MSTTTSNAKAKAPKNISVLVRVRPLIPREVKGKVTCKKMVFDPNDDRKVTVTRTDGSKDITNDFYFNKVWQPSVTQKMVYDEFGKGAVDAAFDGQHGVLFVYGQTGSGKTFTISNDDPENSGVLQQSMRDVWERIASDKEYEYTCSVSYVQLYNELLTNMLDKKEGKVRIQLGPEGRGDVILVEEDTGLTIERPVKNYEETLKCFTEGVQRKQMKQTKMNDTSSRSHTIFTFNLHRSKKISAQPIVPGEKIDGSTRSLEGRVVLCDLAGSERVSRTGAEGETFNEATHINGSLLVLGRVVNALTEKNPQHAPFRESKLTRILQYSLLGNGNTSLVINASPADDSTEETLNAIRFGQRAIRIKQDARRHEVLDYKLLYMQLLAELDQRTDQTLEAALEEEKRANADQLNGMSEKIKSLTAENELLRKENAVLRAGGTVSGNRGEGSKGSAGSADTAPLWLQVNNDLRQMIATRDDRIGEVNNERVRLALLLAEEKRTVFKLAEKLQAMVIRYQMERSQWTQQSEDMSKELTALRMVDYSSASSSVTDDLQSARQGGGDAILQEQLEKAFRQINALKQERAELLSMQAQSEKAIRMLHAEKEKFKQMSATNR